ncbi:FixH family protein [Sporosarcina sp. CAU 1771]
MKKRYMLFSLVFIIGVLAACGKEDEQVEEDLVLLPITVELTVPEAVDVNEVVKMETLVTQGEEKVDDASQVEFEIWEEGKKEESIMIDSVNEKDGVYTGETSFDHDGFFYIQVHVTARNMHTMPTKTVTVGTGGNYEVTEDEENEGQSEGFSMHFIEPKDVKKLDEKDLVVHLDMDGHPFEDANVRYEIWSESDPDNHDWIDADETVAGEYQSLYTFSEEGQFIIVIHVEDDTGLHEHEEFQISVEK